MHRVIGEHRQEEVRRDPAVLHVPDRPQMHLLALLADLEREAAKDSYIATPHMAAAVIWQLGEFRESRAARGLTRIIELYNEDILEDVREALAKIRKTPGETST